MKKLRSATVESVLGTLLYFRAMRKVHTRGIKVANKHVLLATMAYNLKKLMNNVYYKFSIFNLDCQRNQQLVGLYEISNDL